MLSVTNTKYIIIYTRPRIFPSLHLKMAMLMIIKSSMPISSRTEQKSPLLRTDTGCPLFTALNSSQGMGRLCTKGKKSITKYQLFLLHPHTQICSVITLVQGGINRNVKLVLVSNEISTYPTVTSNMLLPMELDRAMSPWPFLATMTLVMRSGILVPAARNVRPITCMCACATVQIRAVLCACD